MVNKFKAYLEGQGSDALHLINEAIDEHAMLPLMRGGVLVGLSGGADSVMLLLTLLLIREKEHFNLLAVHVNHGIRGKEAERDEQFSRQLCENLGVEFLAVREDVPSIARETKTSVEEAARNVRYNAFDRIKSGRNDISAIAVAHNADDNLETVLINMLRGAGSRGVSGIPPVRSDIVRPLIYLSKDTITNILNELLIPFVTDSTNLSDDYTRNAIRHRVIPELSRIAPSLYKSVRRMSRNLREDDECLGAIASELASQYENGKIPEDKLASLHPAVLFRVLTTYAKAQEISIERVHTEAIAQLLMRGRDFSVSVSGGEFRAHSSLCGFYPKSEPSPRGEALYAPLSMGVNNIEKYGISVEICKKCNDFSANVYNISTQADLGSAIIVGDLFLRSKTDGDKIHFGGMTRKLKRLFSDAKIPPEMRERIPVLCDGRGVVWVPGFGVRDDGASGSLHIRISVNTESGSTIFLPEGKRKNKKGKMDT